MTRAELFITAYALLAAASLAWAFWRVARASTVRAAIEGLPLSMAPCWALVIWVAYTAAGTALALQVAAVAASVLGGLGLVRIGVARDSGSEEVVPLSALQQDSATVATFGVWRLAVLGVVAIFVILWIAVSLRS